MTTYSRRGAIALAASVLALPRIAWAADDKVIVATGGTISEAPLYIALDQGYYREQNLDVEMVNMFSGAQMMPSLGTGQVDVGAGAPSAGLYNALAAGINVKIVADKGSTPPGYGYAPILVRKALIDSGKVKTFRDFRGLSVAEVAPGTASLPLLIAGLKRGGLTIKDVKEVFLSFPDHVAAFANGAIDASVTTEPQATQTIQAGTAVRFASSDSIYPNQQLSTILYSAKFDTDRRDVGVRFMAAYIKAARFYNDALKDGRYAGRTGGDVISILVRYTSLKNPSVYRQLVPNGIDPNGRLNLASLQKDLDTFRESGLIKGNATVDQAVDSTIVNDALKIVGPYHRRA